MRNVTTIGFCFGLLLLVGCDILQPPTEAEKFCNQFIQAMNDASDALAQVKDGPSAQAAVGDVDRTFTTLVELYRQLPSMMAKHRNDKISKAKEQKMSRDMEGAVKRFGYECQRVERIRDLPLDFVECFLNHAVAFANVSGDGRAGMLAMQRDMLVERLRMLRSRGGVQSGSNLPTMPAGQPETPAQREERERQKTEALKERLNKLKEREEARRLEEQRRKEEAGPDPSDPQYYEKLVDRLRSDDERRRDQAMTALLTKTPDDVPSFELRKQIAQGFRLLAEDPRIAGSTKEKAIKGLVIWGGKYSARILLGLLNSPHGTNDKDVIRALGELKYAPAARAIAAKLSDHWCHGAAVAALHEIGPEAEDALIEVALSEEPRVCLAAVDMLAEFGTAKCLPLLNRGLSSRNPKVREVCRISIRRVKDRIEATKEPDSSKEED